MWRQLPLASVFLVWPNFNSLGLCGFTRTGDTTHRTLHVFGQELLYGMHGTPFPSSSQSLPHPLEPWRIHGIRTAPQNSTRIAKKRTSWHFSKNLLASNNETFRQEQLDKMCDFDVLLFSRDHLEVCHRACHVHTLRVNALESKSDVDSWNCINCENIVILESVSSATPFLLSFLLGFPFCFCSGFVRVFARFFVLLFSLVS